MIFFAQTQEDTKPAIVEAADSSAAAVQLAAKLTLTVADKFYVVSCIDEPEVIRLDVNLWETVVDWIAVAFKSDAAFWQVMVPTRKGPLVPNLTDWWRAHREEIEKLEASLNGLLGLGQIGPGCTSEPFEVQATTPYVVTKVN